MKLTIDDKKKLAALLEKEREWLRREFDFYVSEGKHKRSHPLNDPTNPPLDFYDEKDDPLAFLDFFRKR